MILLLGIWLLAFIVLGIRILFAVFFAGLDRLGEWMQRDLYR